MTSSCTDKMSLYWDRSPLLHRPQWSVLLLLPPHFSACFCQLLSSNCFMSRVGSQHSQAGFFTGTSDGSTVPAWWWSDCQCGMKHGLHLAGITVFTLLWLAGLNLKLILRSCDQWEFQPFFKGHWQSTHTAGKCLPLALYKETVKESSATCHSLITG